MALQFDASEYFTKAQVRALIPGPPVAPVVTLLDASEAYIDIQVTAPVTPTWASSAPLYIVGYTIEYTGNGSLASVYFLNVGGSYRINGLIQGVSYSIQVAATDFQGRQGSLSAPLVVSTTPNTVPPAVPVFTVTALAIGAQITLTTWNTEVDFAGYELYRDTNAALESDLALLPEASFRGISFTDIGYSVGGNYWYYLKASNYSGLTTDSAIVGPVTITPQPNLVAAELSMLTATAVANGDGSITFTFPASTDIHSPYYHIWRQWGGGLSGWVLVATLPLGELPVYVDNDTVSGLTYQYSASVVNTYGESAFDTLNAPKATAEDTTAPTSVVSNIAYSGTLGGINVTWDATEDPNTAYYIIHWRYYQTGGYSAFNSGEAVITNSDLLDGLEDPVTTYPPTRDALANEFEVEIAPVNSNNVAAAFVSRRDTDGNRVPVEYPELNNYQPAGNIPPAPPTMLAPTINPDNSIVINWSALGISTQYGFKIEKLISPAVIWENLQIVADSTGGTKAYTATGLEPYKFRSTTYTFRVATVDNSGNVSTWVSTAALSAVDTTGPVAYTSGFAATPALGSFQLNWTNGTDQSYFSCVYEIWRKQTASTAPGFVPDSLLIKIVEVSGTSDGKANTWTDLSPTINNKVTAIFALRSVDRYGNGQVDGSGNPIYLATLAAQTSLDIADVNIATLSEVAALTVTVEAAEAELANIASSNVLSSGNKAAVIMLYTNIVNAQPGIDEQAESFGITTERTTYDNSIGSLTAYLSTLTTPTAWDVTPGDTTIVGTVFQANFVAVYSAEQTLLNAIAGASLLLINTATESAATATAEAASATAAAAAATALLAEITGTTVLTPAEKMQLIPDYDALVIDWDGGVGLYDTQAAAVGVSTAAYDAAMTSLVADVAVLGSTFLDFAVNTPMTGAVTGTVLASDFEAVYTAQDALLAAIVTAINATAQTALTGSIDAAASAAAAMALAESAIGKVLVVTAMPAATTVAAGNFVYLTVTDGSYAPGLYESTGAIWTQGSIQASLIVGQIIAGQIAAGAVTAEAIAAGAITAGAIAAGAVTAGKIAVGAVTATMITTGTLDASLVDVVNLNAANITTGTMSANMILFPDGSEMSTASRVITSSANAAVTTGYTYFLVPASWSAINGLGWSTTSSGASDTFNIQASIIGTGQGVTINLAIVVDGNTSTLYGNVAIGTPSGSGAEFTAPFFASITGLSAGSHTIRIYAIASMSDTVSIQTTSYAICQRIY